MVRNCSQNQLFLNCFQNLVKLILLTTQTFLSHRYRRLQMISNRRKRKILINRSCLKIKSRKLKTHLIYSIQVEAEQLSQKSWRLHWGLLASNQQKMILMCLFASSIKTDQVELTSTSSWRLWSQKWVKLITRKHLMRHLTCSIKMEIKRFALTILRQSQMNWMKPWRMKSWEKCCLAQARAAKRRTFSLWTDKASNSCSVGQAVTDCFS